ncbi:MAG TPA: transglutaminase family protein [Acidobacteriaceae bacterium]|jgi:transglutaminase-like putative cysteine protease|nr:transglutaminase family protein [Acidobacteriaceae bacterium]
MMFYSVRHLTKFLYSRPVSESVMEVRMHPRSDSNQRCLSFALSVSPRCRVFSYRDHLGNQVHHFNIPAEHSQLVLVAESLIEMQPLDEIPHFLAPAAWQDLDHLVSEGDYSEMLLPSAFAKPLPALKQLARKLNVVRRDDPLILVRELNQSLFDYFEYAPSSTRADSPINEAIESRQGVCQDFAHVMIALLREVGIPCRYMSGYLRQSEKTGRTSSEATHAWVEAFLPQLGWLGFDPANNLLAGERHIRTALGRDYADVPPTHGIYRGHTDSELHVAVKVEAFDQPPALDRDLPVPEDWSVIVEKAQEPPAPASPLLEIQHQQQQQQ